MTAISTKIPISKIISGKDDTSISKEFEKIDEDERLRPPPSTLKATMQKNQRFNVDQNVIPYDFNRVKISDTLNEGDYVNATWLHTLKEEGHYDELICNQYLPHSMIGVIVCQAPTDATIAQHLRMLYEHDIELVVQISGKSTKSAYEYDCSTSKVTKRIIEVNRVEEFLTQEEWDLTTERGKTSRLVHFRFESQQTNGMLNLDEIDNILKVIAYVRRSIGIKRDSINIAAHDEHGGGSAAAVFIALLRGLEDMDDKTSAPDAGVVGPLKASKETNTLDVFNIVAELRKKRMKMIGNHDDYVLIFKSLQRYAENWRVFQSILEMKTEPTSEMKKDPPLPMASIEVEYVLEHGSAKGSEDENILGSPYGSMELEPLDSDKPDLPTTNEGYYLT